VTGIAGARNGASWHPDGSVIAIPGPDNNVVVFDALSWDDDVEAYRLDDGHTDIVNLVSFSDNEKTKGNILPGTLHKSRGP
jgi:WD40 repeat protein